MDKKFQERVDMLSNGEKQLAFLLKLSDTLRTLDNPEDIEEAATTIALNFLEADRCHYSTIEGENISIMRDAVRGDLPSVAGVYSIGSFALYKAALKQGVPFVVVDVHANNTIDEDLKKICLQFQYGSFINVPIIKNGKPVGLLSLVQSKPRKWTDAEVQIVVETAERTWAAVEGAKAEVALRKSEEKYRTLLTSIDQGFTLCELIRNKEGKGIDICILEVNTTYEKQTGITKEMVIGKPLLQVFPSLNEWIETYAAVVDNQLPVTFEHYFDVTDRWFAIKAYPVEMDRFLILFSDISERKQAEEKIKESEKRFRTMADASPILIWTIDANGLPSYYNKTFLDFIGVLREEDILDWTKIVHPDDVQSTLDTLNAAIAGRRPYSLECRLLRYDGQWRWMLAHGNPSIGANNEFLGFVGSSVDISERKQTEENITESEHRFQELIYSSPSMVAILRGENMIIEIANSAIINSWGKGKDVVGKSIFSILPEIVEQGFDKLLLDVYKTGQPFHAYERAVNLKRNGIWEKIYYNFVYQAQRNVNGELVGVAILANEVTPQALLNKKIKASEEKFKLLVQQAPVAICVLRGKDYVIETMNEGMCELWDKSLEQALDQPVFDVLPEMRDQGIKDLLDKVYHTGERCVMQELSVNLMRNGQLENAFVKFVYEPLREADGSISGVMALAHEITEQVVARKKVEQSERKFEAAILAVEGIIWTSNAIGEMIGEQPGWAKLTGQIFEEYQGFGWSSAIHPDEAQSTLDAWKKAIENKSTFEFEHRLMTKQEGCRLFSVKAVPAFDENGSTVQWVGVHTDITEQREAAQRIKESETYFRILTDTVPAIIWITEPDGSCSYLNKLWYDYTGQTEEEAKGFGWLEAIHPDDKAQAAKVIIEANSAHKPFSLTYRLRNARGEYRWAVYSGSAKFNADDEFEGMIGTVVDVHEEKLAEERLTYRTALLEAHNQASVDGILLVDARGKIISYNQRFIEIWNMPQHIVDAKDDEAALSFAMTQLVKPQQFIDKVKYLYENPTETCHDELEFENGKIIERNGYPVVGEGGIYYAWSWIFKDITERKIIEQDLKNAKEQLELTFKNIPAGVYLLNEKGEMIYVNDRGAAVYGDFTPDDLLAEKNLPDLLKKADELFERFDENGNYFGPQNSPAYISLTTGLPSQAVLKQINKVTTETRWHYVQGAPLFKEDGRVSMVLITSTDITVQKIAEQKMKESEERFRLLSEEMPQFVWTGDADGHLTYFNEAVYKYSGLTKEDVANGAWINIVHPDDRNDNIRLWTQSIATGKDFIFEHRFRRADGEYRWQLSRAVPQRDTQGVIQQWIGTSTDIHDKKNIEEKLENLVAERTRELQRSNDDLQQFAHVASHDLKEPVRKVKTFTSRLEQHLDGRLDETGTRFIERIHVATNRMFNMIEGVLAYSTTNASMQIPQLVDLTEVVKSVEADLELALQKTGATLTYNNLPILEGAPVLLYQLFVNLISNSVKFAKTGQPPRIKISSEVIFEDDIKFACITLQDNGIGFDPELAEQIFGSFVRLNSKDKYEGTGLGLSLCKKIVDRHGGRITANGIPDEGATFLITLPVHQIQTSI